MFKFKRNTLAPALLAVCAGLMSAQAAASTVTLRITSASPRQMEDSRALQDTAKFLEKETNGSVILKPYLSASLFGEVDGVGAAQNGLVDMAVACTCNFTKLTKAFLFADLPYVFKSEASAREVWDGDIGAQARASFAEKTNLIALAFAPSGGGARQFLNTKKAVKVPADIVGMKIRTTATPLEQGFWKEAGAIPTPVDISETYTALQQGLVDAEHLQPMWTTTLKHDEVVRYATEINALYVYRAVVINKKAYDKLDAAQKKALTAAMAYFEDKAYQYNEEERKTSLAEMAKHGVKTVDLSPDEMKQWEELGAKFRQLPLAKDSVRAGLVDRVLAAQAGAK
ncbi:TRAP transporter substrate-binding protein [uncultured Castellaniella sp.]|uniref:TRAP transporter substrate-binding protein n=1 Tax=uncultured Castellaniella sp. TaxID=647907 RepID=UPI0026085149|nr:TRAP transporter substrate-binding protein [uncultured Castellaniella sp.]